MPYSKTNKDSGPDRKNMSFGQMVRVCVTAATCIAPFTHTASAQGFAEEVGSSERLNAVGQLGALSQRVISAACNLSADVSPDDSYAVLTNAFFTYQLIVEATLYGDPTLGIVGEESRPRTLQVIDDLNTTWSGLQGAITAENVTDAQVEFAISQSSPLLREVEILVSEISAQYADPVELLQADAFLIDLAGKMRMLSQKISKDVCVVSSGFDVLDSRSELEATVSLFDRYLDALQNGLPELGVRPPQTESISDNLQLVSDQWAAIRPTVEDVIAGNPISNEKRSEIFEVFIRLEARISNLVYLYDKNSRLGQ